MGGKRSRSSDTTTIGSPEICNDEPHLTRPDDIPDIGKPEPKKRGPKKGHARPPGRKYNDMTQGDLAKCLDLHVKGIPNTEIAKIVGTKSSTVHLALQRFKSVFTELEYIDDYRATKTRLLEAAELRLLKSMLDEATIEKASLNNRAYAFQQVYQALRLERGQSTANVSGVFRFTGIPSDKISETDN